MNEYAFRTINDLMLRSNEACSINLELTCVLNNQEATSFRNIDQFPRSRGVYLLYLGDGQNSKPIYIGCAKDNDRTIQIRCKQYLMSGNGGDSFRGKIEAFLNVNSESTISYIKENVSAKFVIMDDTDSDEILWRESLYIWSYNSILNTIIKPNTLIV